MSAQWALSRKRDWPKGPGLLAAVATGWFPKESEETLRALLAFFDNAIAVGFDDPPINPRVLALALLTPFASRLASYSQGDVAHVKRGGLCVYTGWKDDLSAYLHALLERIETLSTGGDPISSRHTVILADARKSSPGRARFRAMLTSPPYPNRTDYFEIFGPENAMLDMLGDALPDDLRVVAGLIGTNRTRGLQPPAPVGTSAREFVDQLLSKNWSNRKQGRDETGYYYKYYSNYFTSIEALYGNVARYAAKSRFRGFIVVRDNSHQGVTVPAAAAIVETWARNGFDARIASADETFHVGTKNPRARGVRAKHMEYVIEVSR